jgi:surface polysaccharide O-acyltransferase-like enzyme
MSREIEWIEIARTGCMMLVVLGHVLDIFIFHGGEAARPWELAFLLFLSFCGAPVFLISGFLLRIELDRSPEPVRYGEFLRHKVATILAPFFVWNAIYLVFARVLMGWPLFSGSALFSFLTGFVHLYFVFVLFQFFLLYPLLHRHLQGSVLNRALLASIVLSLGFYGVSEYVLWVSGISEPTFEWHYGKLFFGWSAFFMTGVWLGARPDRVELLAGRAFPLFVIASVLLVPYYYETSRQLEVFHVYGRGYFLLSGLPYQLAGALFMIGLFRSVERSFRKGRILNYLIRSGVDTFEIYIVHYLFLLLLVAAWTGLDLPKAMPVKIPVLFRCVWLLSQGFAGLRRRPSLAGAGKLLFGCRD